MTSGIIFDIQRFSVHDGPGIRTTVFLKGCSLRCFWCHNPEGIRPKPEIQFEPAKCIGCGECVLICPQGAQHLDDGERRYNRDDCIVCGQCVETCYTRGLALVGKTMAVDEVLNEVLADRVFYRDSGGGVTLSGGEPVLQTDFVGALQARCQAEGIHTAIETAGYYPWDRLERLLPHIDLVMMDLKHMDSAQHRAATGAPNEQILDNARRLAQTDTALIFRIPVIPTVNDTVEAVSAMARFVLELSAMRGAPLPLQLLPFHRLAEHKYTSLGRDYAARALPDAVQNFQELKAVVQRFGLG
jgi:pyruvate formate lyase activating enzyme